MLKITLHDTASEFRLRLEGKLAGPWVQELSQCWQAAAPAAAGRKTVVDLREVDFVDGEGQALLCRMRQGGVKFLAGTPLIRDIVTRCGTVDDRTAEPGHVPPNPGKHGSRPRPL